MSLTLGQLAQPFGDIDRLFFGCFAPCSWAQGAVVAESTLAVALPRGRTPMVDKSPLRNNV